MARCPICDAAVQPRSSNPSYPFCTARCKTIDLGKWLNEEYRIPVPDAELDEDDLEDLTEGASKKSEDMRH
ncbi:MAG: DNA gyrase inhibitor YacG [Labilithrix sp.]|nr:DNA gyrase inhibitor YacG [Labilithrix sp.]